MRVQATAEQLRHAQRNIQANLVRAGKYSDQGTRNWSLYYFFRIMTEEECSQTLQDASAMLAEPQEARRRDALFLDLEQPSRAWSRRRSPVGPPADTAAPVDVAAGPVAVAPQPADAGPQPARPPAPRAEPGPPPPAQAFLSWLKVLASADKTALALQAKALADQLAGPAPDGPAQAADELAAAFRTMLSALHSKQTLGRLAKRTADPAAIQQFLRVYAEVLNDPDIYKRTMRLFGATPAEAGETALQGSLCGVTVYELLRQAAPAFLGGAHPGRGIVRGEAYHRQVDGKGIYDPLPVNLAFTFHGLMALNVDPTTLASFPDPFKQGMAARAARLSDTGPSAPANWEAEYGLPSLHGFFTGGFPAGSEKRRIKEAVWRQLRADITAFNNRRSNEGRALRAALGLLFRQVGLDIVRIELGQDPYDANEDGDAVPKPERFEHFGYRDGLSQPFADLGLRDPPAGGGTPDIDGTWSPVAPGEIYLDLPDEDGEVQELPIAPALRRGSTFIVFRKLEQDVAGFHAFLSKQRPEGPDAQKRLAAQFLGRWPNGTPLVLSPDHERTYKADKPAPNNFRFAADDPYGLKCPLAAHIRRANPRDSGGRGEVKRHRILRRGIAYGGPMLTSDSLGDGEKRGLLFVAVNSRIDLQFEVVQADWINGGELLGQAGLGLCPLVGAHAGGVEDSFLEAGAAAPVVGIPRFVTTRGGEYFFAPGITALRLMARGEDFAVRTSRVPFRGAAMGASATPALFDPERLTRYATQILGAPGGPASVVRVQLPLATGETAPQTIVFVGQHQDVTRVLSDKATGPQTVEFSVEAYQITGQRITRGYDFIVGTEDVGPTSGARTSRYKMLCDAWRKLEARTPGGTKAAIARIARNRLTAALKRTASTGRIDLVHDLGVQVAYGVVTELIGIPGPDWLTELAPALPFGTQHVASLPPDWLAAVKGGQPQDPGLTSMQIWSVLILADMLGNLQSDHEAYPFSRQAGSEMLSQIDAVLTALPTAPAAHRPSRPTLAAMLAEDAASSSDPGAYLREAAVVLMELIGDTLAAVPATLGNILWFLLFNRIDLTRLIEVLRQPPPVPGISGVQRLIFEAERFNPILPVLLRRCETATTLPSGATINAGEMVAAVVKMADMDPRVFPDPEAFSLAPFIPGPVRNPADYLTFGAAGPHLCWGRDLVAMPLLEACIGAAAALDGLRQVAGPAGQTQSLVGVGIGLPARFTQVVWPAF